MLLNPKCLSFHQTHKGLVCNFIETERFANLLLIGSRNFLEYLLNYKSSKPVQSQDLEKSSLGNPKDKPELMPRLKQNDLYSLIKNIYLAISLSQKIFLKILLQKCLRKRNSLL
jgi:hypothetical protein